MNDQELDAVVQQARATLQGELADWFSTMPPEQVEMVAERISEFMWGRIPTPALRKIKRGAPTRILEEGADVNTDDDGNQLGHAGPTLPDIWNFLSTDITLEPGDGRQVNIRPRGGGTDCTLDYLISTCWATEVAAGRGTEGQTMTSLAGCTFKVYSTLGAVFNDINNTATYDTNDWATVFICQGVYDEDIATPLAINKAVVLRGSGIQRTILRNTDATPTVATIPWVASSSVNKIELHDLWVCAPEAAGGGGLPGIKGGTNDSITAYNCGFTGRTGTDQTQAGVYAAGGIGGGLTARFFDCVIDGPPDKTYSAGVGLAMDGNDSVLQVYSSRFQEASYGVFGGEDTFVQGCTFGSGVDVGVRLGATTTASDAVVTGCFFRSPVGVYVYKGNNAQIANNHFTNADIGVDLSDNGGFSGGGIGTVVKDNVFSEVISVGDICIKLPASLISDHWEIHDNHAFGDTSVAAPSSMFSGTRPVKTRIYNNFINGVSDTYNNVYSNGTLGVVWSGGWQSYKIYWGAFVITFGSTRVSVAAGSHTYASAAATYYVSVNSSGTVTATTTGSFPAGEYPLATVTTDGGTMGITSIVDYATYLQTTATGYGAAPDNEPFVTIGNTSGLSAERALTAGNGVGFDDGGANGAATLKLVPLTALYDQSGAFNWVNRGGDLLIANSKDLLLYSDNSATPSTLTGSWDAATGFLTSNGSTTDPGSSTVAFTLSPEFIITGANAQNLFGLSANAELSTATVGALAHTGVIIAVNGLVTLTENAGASTLTADDIRSLSARAVVGATTTATVRSGLYVSNATGTGTVTTQYGIYMENMTKGGTDWAIYSLGGVSSHLGAMRFGSNTAPTNTTNGDLTATRLIVPDAAIVHSAISQLGGPVVIPTQGALRFSDSDNSHYTGFKAHATTTASVEYTWPAADGTSGYQLTTDGAGVLSWAAAGGGGGSPLTVQEEDGTPIDAAVTIIRVPNGGLTDNGVGDVSLGYELSGAVSTHAGAADPHTGYVREADANWIDLTDGGATTLHSHAGGSAHTLLDGSTHSDTLADTVTDGDVIIGNATPKWSSLAISVPAANVRNVLGVDNGELRPSWKAMLDGTAPADVATSASAGTSLIAAHRDHVHKAAHSGIDTTSMKQTLLLMAGAGRPTTTSGCGGPVQVEAGTNDVDYLVLDFDATTKEYAFWNVIMPDNYDGSTITARFIWTTTSSTNTHDAVWGLQARAYGDATTIDAAYGTTQEVSDTATATANQVLISAATSALTIAGSPAGGQYVAFRAYRDPANGTDDLNVDARLLGIQIEYGVNALSA